MSRQNTSSFTMSLHDITEILGAEHLGDDAVVKGISTDTRTLKPGELFIALNGPNFNAHEFAQLAMDKGAVACLVEKTLDIENQLIVKDTHLALGQLAKAWRQKFDYPVIAITGSNGKTTVKEMIAAIFTQQHRVMSTIGNLNNDIGVPLTLFRMNDDYNVAVIEMGANHIGEIDYLTSLALPDIAVITNIGRAHLEGFGGIEKTAAAKAEIFHGLAKEGIAIINADDRFYDYFIEEATGHRLLSFAIDNPAADVKASWHSNEQGSQLKLITPAGQAELSLKLLGRHNVMNALAAVAASLAAEIPLPQIVAGLESMRPVNGRLQLKQGVNNSRVIDDTYNANPSSLHAALDVLQEFSGKHFLALGDMAELGEDAEKLHAEAGDYARNTGVDSLYSFGKLAARATDKFGEKGFSYTKQEDMIAALRSELSHEVTLLVKGSRSMHMENVVDALTIAEG